MREVSLPLHKELQNYWLSQESKLYVSVYSPVRDALSGLVVRILRHTKSHGVIHFDDGIHEDLNKYFVGWSNRFRPYNSTPLNFFCKLIIPIKQHMAKTIFGNENGFGSILLQLGN